MHCPLPPCCIHQDALSHRLRVLVNLLNRRSEAMIQESLGREITPMQGRIIGYLGLHREQDIFQRDIESMFSITRSTASKTLTLMEENGLIRRCGVSRDARLKKIEPTDKALGMLSRFDEQMIRCETLLCTGLTEEERATLTALLQKLQRNIAPPRKDMPPAPAAVPDDQTDKEDTPC